MKLYGHRTTGLYPNQSNTSTIKISHIVKQIYGSALTPDEITRNRIRNQRMIDDALFIFNTVFIRGGRRHFTLHMRIIERNNYDQNILRNSLDILLQNRIIHQQDYDRANREIDRWVNGGYDSPATDDDN